MRTDASLIQAYLEFFCPPERAEALLATFEQSEDFTYHAVTKDGQIRTNCKENPINAVTWGIFPGKEVLQPTIVEQSSFEAWKDEAFELGQQWANLYPAGSPSNKLLGEVFNSYYLINIVHNDFRHEDKLAIFRPLLNGEELPASPKTNGMTNGH